MGLQKYSRRSTHAPNWVVISVDVVIIVIIVVVVDVDVDVDVNVVVVVVVVVDSPLYYIHYFVAIAAVIFFSYFLFVPERKIWTLIWFFKESIWSLDFCRQHIYKMDFLHRTKSQVMVAVATSSTTELTR